MLSTLPFRNIVAVDFEFEFGGHASFDDAKRSGERARPVCMVAKDLRSGETWRRWRDQFGSAPPFPIGPDTLIVAFYASAEMGCFRALGWPTPARILDLFTEFRNRTNKAVPKNVPRQKAGLIDALSYFGLDPIDAQEKDDLRKLILGGGPWSHNERAAILEYCATDIVALDHLLPTMLPGIDLPRALLRGRYMAAAAAMEFAGVPIDVPTLGELREHWTDIQDDLIAEIDAQYRVYDGRSFRAQRWAEYLIRENIPWPLLESGALDLRDKTFREMPKGYPKVAPMRELRYALSKLRLNDLAVGADGRNRIILSAFSSRTGRNQPSNSHYIFGPSVFLRSLIQPPPGHGVAYIDWSQQEFAIAAALSGDGAMQAAYASGDPYLALAKRAGAVPADATKESHGPQRELFKTCTLGVQYGMTEYSLAQRLGQPLIVARDLLRAHRETYQKFWRWSDAAVDCAMLRGALHTVFGWRLFTVAGSNPRSIRNFPMQANGSEMLRLACCLGTERGIEICAPVHDAVLICAPVDRLDEDIAKMRACMAEASRAVLDGFELRTDCPSEARIMHPGRYSDSRGARMWDRVMHLVAERKKAAA
jgi:hypothetical protein